MKRVIIIHGWMGSPEKDFIPWVKQELEKKGYQVTAPLMPDPDHPKIEVWVNKLSEVVGEVDLDTVLIGHSIGSQTILRFLESLPDGKKVAKVITIAGWFTLTPESTPTDEDKQIIEPWIKNTIDLNNVKNKSSEFISIFSNNDPFVPLEENSAVFKEKLGARIMVESNKGHYTSEDGVDTLPLLLEIL